MKAAQSCALRIEARPPLGPSAPHSVLAVIHETGEDSDTAL